MNIILEIDGKYYKSCEFDYNQKCGCSACAINEKCGNIPWDDGPICNGNQFKEADISIDIDPTEELIRKVLSLSDDADKAFKERCRLFNGATIDEQLDNQRRQRTGLLLEERIRLIKDHWKDFYYLQHIRSREGLITVKI